MVLQHPQQLHIPEGKDDLIVRQVDIIVYKKNGVRLDLVKRQKPIVQAVLLLLPNPQTLRFASCRPLLCRLH